MKTDAKNMEKIRSRDLDRIQEVKQSGKGWIRYGKILLFGGFCFSLGLWIGRDTNKQISFETIRQAEGLPVLFAARGQVKLRQSMFSIVPIPKQARLDLSDVEIGIRRPMVKMPSVNKLILKKKKAPTKTPVPVVSRLSAIQPVKTKHVKHGFYSIQIRAFKDRAEAMTFFRGLKTQGYGVWAEIYRDRSGVTWTRILVGRFKSKRLATMFRTRFKKTRGIDGLVVLKDRTTKRINMKKDKLQKKRRKNANTTH